MAGLALRAVVLTIGLYMLAALIDGTHGVQCYECEHVNGTGSPHCIEPFPDPVPLTNISITECNNYCVKSVTLQTTVDQVGFQVEEFFGTTRSCSSQCIEVCYKFGAGHARETCTYCCEGDLCNAGHRLSTSNARRFAIVGVVGTVAAYMLLR